ncbi:hypothetical protein [Cognatishimia sp. F0-27]|uniref:hypothetical protein n=1 Tax=Cognatishimia sp. F0-27 TaxID=2816855 RepID=UPI001D0C662D|nr:hypothetical protein [Cognatishimia sp. F0-27]MCC1491264.1 hypothetical protein [Cognatishimia sp. F0-27]
MHQTSITATASSLRGPERRVIALLRAWHAGEAHQAAAWKDLCKSLGVARARGCLRAFEEMLALMDRHGWRCLTILPETAEGWSEDELSVARFVMAATEQQRDVALSEAAFLVRPSALLPLLTTASRFGLPLLCEDCRARVMGRA